MAETPKHICGQCGKGFPTAVKYKEHLCETTGFKPTDPQHLGEGFVRASEAALARGEKRKELEANGVSPEEAVAQTRQISTDVK